MLGSTLRPLSLMVHGPEPENVSRARTGADSGSGTAVASTTAAKAEAVMKDFILIGCRGREGV